MEPVDPRVDPSLVPSGSRAIVVAEHQDEYKDLPSVRTPAVVVDGRIVKPSQVITRWALTIEERAAIVRGEDIYVTILSNGSINPLFVTVGPVDWR
jgi:dihydrofolate reductase